MSPRSCYSKETKTSQRAHRCPSNLSRCIPMLTNSAKACQCCIMASTTTLFFRKQLNPLSLQSIEQDSYQNIKIRSLKTDSSAKGGPLSVFNQDLLPITTSLIAINITSSPKQLRGWQSQKSSRDVRGRRWGKISST